MKKMLLVLICLTFIILLIACGDKNSNDTDNKTNNINGDIDNSIIENYIFMLESTDKLAISYPVLGVINHGEQLFYWYMDSAPQLIIRGLSSDRNVIQQEIQIPLPEGTIQVSGMQIDENNNFSFIMVKMVADKERTVTYGLYNHQGDNISSLDLSFIVASGTPRFHIAQTVFSNEGNYVIAVSEGGFAYELYLLSYEGTLIGQLQLDYNLEIIKLKDDRVVALSLDGEYYSLREIDFTTGDWGESLPLTTTTTGIQKLFTAEVTQPYDFLFSDGNFLIGYKIDTATLTPLINLIEVGVVNVWDYYIGFFPDNRFFVLSIDFSIFNRISREDLAEHQTILTLGGIWISDEIRREVVRFNQENQVYQIELIDFSSDGDWEAAMLRFQVEMVTGRGPDILFNSGAMQIEAGFMVDLNPFIDIDTEINRSDFLPNFMNTLITIDGALPFISTAFTIDTMIATQETAPQIMPLTFETLLLRLGESDKPHLFGNWMLRDNFLENALLYSSETFFDFEHNLAKIDNDDFIHLLEIAKNLPTEPVFEDSMVGEIKRMHDGEQLLYFFNFHSPVTFQHFAGMLGDNIVIIGMPTPTGGRHIIKPEPGLGINIASPHKDAAWSFIRRLLLPNAVDQFGFPLRFDKFEDSITEAMKPHLFWHEDDPETGAKKGDERPTRTSVGMAYEDGTYEEVTYYTYSLSEEEAIIVRGIIMSADMYLRYNETISMIVMEDSQAFFNGTRTAEDTVRIIQNRVQTYLNERG